MLGVPESGRAFRGGESFDQRETEFGVRGVLGLTYRIPRSPVDMFLEVAPVFFIAPNGDMDIDAGIGARVYP